MTATVSESRVHAAPTPKFASVGLRVHTLATELVVHREGQPVVALCGAVYVPTTFEPGPEIPLCRECQPYRIEVALLKLDLLNEKRDRLEAHMQDLYNEAAHL